MKSQNARVLSHLKSGLPITALGALKSYNIMRLASRIYDLRQDGHDIAVTNMTTNTGKTVAQYKLIQAAK